MRVSVVVLTLNRRSILAGHFASRDAGTVAPDVDGEIIVVGNNRRTVVTGAGVSREWSACCMLEHLGLTVVRPPVGDHSAAA